VKPSLPPALLLVAVITTGATACEGGVWTCACPAARAPFLVCGTALNYHGKHMEPVLVLSLGGPTRRAASAPKRSAIPRLATWGVVKNRNAYAITTRAKCARAPVVTVKPRAAARTVVVARGSNGGIAGLTLAMVANTTIVVRAYRGRRLIGQLTIPRQSAPTPPPPTPRQSPSPHSPPCGRLGDQGAEPLYCLAPSAPVTA
jgi:hypothetical protein